MDFNVRVRVSDGSAIMGHTVWDAFFAQLNTTDLSKFVLKGKERETAHTLMCMQDIQLVLEAVLRMKVEIKAHRAQ